MKKCAKCGSSRGVTGTTCRKCTDPAVYEASVRASIDVWLAGGRFEP